MPNIGDDDVFENAYMHDLRAKLSKRGVLVEYEFDRAAIDVGVHMWVETDDGAHDVSGPRVWMQAKGYHAETLTAEEFAAAEAVKTHAVSMDHVRFWYNAPEPVYLVEYVESVDTFFADDVRDLVDKRGGLGKVVEAGATTTFHIPKSKTLDDALDRMPTHRSMRIDGPAWRGRPLGHGIDPMRSELAPMAPDLFIRVVTALLNAHDFRVHGGDGKLAPLSGLATDRPTVAVGTLYLTYEWVLPLFTEFGFDDGTDFRIEGGPLYALARWCSSSTRPGRRRRNRSQRTMTSPV
ncbi:DUF4365 domain-containing protein [Planctomonas deserti]|uniref:DUF4365 domain-containing protein n=1 Tax=Planctomonas deserti TaxID=2144185 RepID=UPI000D34194E|nr:DUF4365 domain-containing protein [Planctomonas deserti]